MCLMFKTNIGWCVISSFVYWEQHLNYNLLPSDSITFTSLQTDRCSADLQTHSVSICSPYITLLEDAPLLHFIVSFMFYSGCLIFHIRGWKAVAQSPNLTFSDGAVSCTTVGWLTFLWLNFSTEHQCNAASQTLPNPDEIWLLQHSKVLKHKVSGSPRHFIHLTFASPASGLVVWLIQSERIRFQSNEGY